ncbi:MAG: hypothetical protein ACFFER_20010, partial [Candidatus Thorarchaeota archaeon]
NANAMIRVLKFDGRLGWSYKGTPYERLINKDGVTTEFVRCPDPTLAGVVLKITARKRTRRKAWIRFGKGITENPIQRPRLGVLSGKKEWIQPANWIVEETAFCFFNIYIAHPNPNRTARFNLNGYCIIFASVVIYGISPRK